MQYSNQLTFNKKVENGITLINLHGPIDEHADLQAAFSDINTSSIKIDLHDISRINSLGIRLWLEAIRLFIGIKNVEYINCSLTIVNQLNILDNFSEFGKIVSFSAPYYCNICNKSVECNIYPGECTTEDDEGDLTATAPARNCPECSSDLEFAEDEEKYFFFLNKNSN